MAARRSRHKEHYHRKVGHKLDHIRNRAQIIASRKADSEVIGDRPLQYGGTQNDICLSECLPQGVGNALLGAIVEIGMHR
jgi:hypothetical protein